MNYQFCTYVITSTNRDHVRVHPLIYCWSFNSIKDAIFYVVVIAFPGIPYPHDQGGGWSPSSLIQYATPYPSRPQIAPFYSVGSAIRDRGHYIFLPVTVHDDDGARS